MASLKVSHIIHLFAFLHVLVTLVCRLVGYEDALLLTILTMSMAVIICVKLGLRLEFAAACVIVVNVLGYLFGTLGANLIRYFIDNPYVVHPLATLITTEILGWGIVGLKKLLRHGISEESRGILSYPRLKWLILSMVIIFFMRIGFVLLFSTRLFRTWDFIEVTRRVFSNSAAMIILICLNIIYVRFSYKKKLDFNSAHGVVFLAAFVLLASLLETLMVGLGLPFSLNANFKDEFLQLFIISLLTEVTLYCIILMIGYAANTRSEMYAARGKANRAQFRYMKLKQQVNPHFLFNSLNILDCLVCEGKNEQASIYIHKLASLYRYMIKNENEKLVHLRDELVFVNLYVDLLKVRFPVGFNVEIDVDDSLKDSLVLPCSIQMLIENAIKHNAVDSANPLVIKIETPGDGTVSIKNNIVPKVSSAPSTGMGQNYIRQQYLDLSGKPVEVTASDTEYNVVLPLL